jgi:hypothetical protein
MIHLKTFHSIDYIANMLQQLTRASLKKTRAINSTLFNRAATSELKRNFSKSASLFARKVTLTEEGGFRQKIQIDNTSFTSDGAVKDGGKGEGIFNLFRKIRLLF